MSPTATEQVRRKWDAVSTLDTLDLAARRARDLGLGDWIAELSVPDEVRAEVGQPTPPRRPRGRHVSLWATPSQLLSYVVGVTAVEQVQST